MNQTSPIGHIAFTAILNGRERCRRCGNLTSRYNCNASICNGILAIDGGCAPLEGANAAAEIR